MPTYEYECEACEHGFEKFQSMTDKPVKTCPVCGRRKVRRLIGTGAGIIFKGSGFYETDYRSKEYKEAAKKDGDSSSKSESKSEKPSASKAETSSAGKESAGSSKSAES